MPSRDAAARKTMSSDLADHEARVRALLTQMQEQAARAALTRWLASQPQSVRRRGIPRRFPVRRADGILAA
jgi:hypothetical protein